MESLRTRGAPLQEVLARVRLLLVDHLLLGHGLNNDLTALGLTADVPPAQRLDTMTHPGFANRGGGARSLAILAARHLGATVQGKRGGPRAPGGGGVPTARAAHDPVQDAAAVMLLYQRVSKAMD